VRVEPAASVKTHQIGRLDLDVGLGDWELHALILPYRSGVSREWGDDDTRGTLGRVDSRLGERGCDGYCG
jgi:hypothetical protein